MLPHRNQRGSEVVEFALVFPLLLVLTLAVADVSRAFFIKNMLHQASREGARQLVVGTMADTAAARVRVNQVLAAARVSASSITYLGPVNRQVAVRVGSDFHWIFPGLFDLIGAGSMTPFTLTAETWMRQETP
jgi:Flp pilus assembly protein TadG